MVFGLEQDSGRGVPLPPSSIVVVFHCGPAPKRKSHSHAASDHSHQSHERLDMMPPPPPFDDDAKGGGVLGGGGGGACVRTLGAEEECDGEEPPPPPHSAM